MFGSGVLCTEDAVSGCVADILGGAFPGFAVNVASDGESAFDPFGAGFDTSDGIQFVGFDTIQGVPWVEMGDPRWVLAPGTTQTWVLPSSIPGCGSENEPGCEPIGGWYQPGFTWAIPVPQVFTILSADGAWSDTIRIDNGGPSGSAELTITSDPGAVPEPGTLALFGLGFVGIGYRAMRRKRA
jgi:hypothetical protein